MGATTNPAQRGNAAQVAAVSLEVDLGRRRVESGRRPRSARTRSPRDAPGGLGGGRRCRGRGPATRRRPGAGRSSSRRRAPARRPASARGGAPPAWWAGPARPVQHRVHGRSRDPDSGAIQAGPSLRRWRSTMIRASTSVGVRPGCGALGRSASRRPNPPRGTGSATCTGRPRAVQLRDHVGDRTAVFDDTANELEAGRHRQTSINVQHETSGRSMRR